MAEPSVLGAMATEVGQHLPVNLTQKRWIGRPTGAFDVAIGALNDGVCWPERWSCLWSVPPIILSRNGNGSKLVLFSFS